MGNINLLKEAEATDEIRHSLAAFGSDVLLTKFPSCIDGLKDIIRRIVWFMREYKEPKDLNKVIGDVGEMHVSGDSSIYGAIIRLGQDFMVGHPIVEIHGKSGQYYSPGDAAAPRYLQAQLSEFSKDIFFNGVNLKTLPMVPTKNFGSMEPKYLIPRLPTALFLGNLTVGFGFKSHIPMIDFKDVCDLVLIFSEFYAKGGIGFPKHSRIAKYAVPSFPIANLIRNRDELIEHYSVGDYTCPIIIDGTVDMAGNAIVLRTVPYGIDFGTVTRALRDSLTDQKHWLWNHIATVNQYSADVAEVSIPLKRGQNPFEVLEKLKPLIRFSNRWHPIYSYMKDGKALTLNPPMLIYLWYKERALSIAGSLRYRQTELVNTKMLLEAMLIISDYSDEVIQIIKSSETEEDAVKNLYQRFRDGDKGLTWRQAKIVASQKISILAKANKRQIIADLEQTENDIKVVLSDIGNVSKAIYNDASYLKKKYGSTKKSTLSNDFIGCVVFEGLGRMQYTNRQEMLEILSTKGWGTTKRRVMAYRDDSTYWTRKHGGNVIPMETSKESPCQDIIEIRYSNCPYTLSIDRNNWTACVVDKPVVQLLRKSEKTTLCPVTETFYAMWRDGTITKENIKDFSMRKTVSKGSKSDIMFALPEFVTDMIVCTMNKEELNVIRMDSILYEQNGAFRFGKLTTLPIGMTEFIGFVPMNNSSELICNVPPECLKGLAIEQLSIKNISSLFTKSRHLSINLNRIQKNLPVKLLRTDAKSMMEFSVQPS